MQHRDMTEKQFLTICRRHGILIEADGAVILADAQTCSHRAHGGLRRRQQLDYLLRSNEQLRKNL